MTGYDIQADTFSVQIGTPLDERTDLFVRGLYTRTRASMDPWSMTSVFVTPDALTTDPTLAPLLNDWTIVDELSDVDVQRFDVTLGARWRGASGWGVEVGYTLTDYDDRDPILEDETGLYSAFTAMVSRSF
ncbi:MAG: hypothetical protein Kow0062_01230 [Acidobacteriota bacterium]|nr:MAG: hypothetical protein D6738_13275 [Acidobacteriota bacterium]